MREITNLLVEGWMRSPHSYALVNAYQLEQLNRDPRLLVRHQEVPPYDQAWASLPSVLPSRLRANNVSIPAPRESERTDVIYRISFPLRAYPGSVRTFVFGTREFLGLGEPDWIGPDWTSSTAAADQVEFVTPTHWSAQGLCDLGIQRNRIHVIPHGFDPSLFSSLTDSDRAATRHHLQIAPDNFIFFNLGAMTWNKGVEILLAAFALHVERHPGAMLLLKTMSSLHGNFQGTVWRGAAAMAPQVLNPNVQAAIRLIDRPMTSADIARLFHASDAYVSPYRAEGFNLPVLEAMGAGLPVAVTAGGATDDFCTHDCALKIAAEIRQHEDGLHLEPELASVLKTLEVLRFDEPARRRLAAAGKAHATDHFSWTHVGARLAHLMTT